MLMVGLSCTEILSVETYLTNLETARPCVLPKQRGQAHLPNPELIIVTPRSSLERLSSKTNRMSLGVSGLGRRPCPRCLAKAQFEAFRLDGAFVDEVLTGI